MTSSRSTARRYLALYLPMPAWDAWQGRIGRIEAGATASVEAPLVFTEREGNAIRVTACSPAALRIGLASGLTLADARARAPDLASVDRDHDAEARLLARVVAGCGRYTPMAAADSSDGAILDIQGCTHRFGGGEAGLVADLRRQLETLGVMVRIGFGDTPEAARARARFGEPEGPLEQLPVEALEPPRETIVALRRAGLRTIGDLACRPRAMLAARFGDLALRLTRLLGEEDRRITPERHLPPVQALRRFAEPIGRTEQALVVLEALLADVAAVLLERHQGGRRFVARFFRSDGAVQGLAVATGRPVRDPALVMRLFHERLEALADPIDPGFGFDAVRLDVPATEPLAPQQQALAGEEDKAEPLAELIDRLVARLGAGNVRRLLPLDSHIPECAAAFAGPDVAAAWDAPVAGEPPLRPLSLFDPPQPIAVDDFCDGPPDCFAWGPQIHRVTRWEGPERIAAAWWQRRDGAGLTRDYYRVEDQAGRRFWLFRHGLAGVETAQPDWYLHGLFA